MYNVFNSLKRKFNCENASQNALDNLNSYLETIFIYISHTTCYLAYLLIINARFYGVNSPYS